MKRHIVGIAAAAFFALTASSAWAQPNQDTGPSRPAGPAGGGGGGTSTSSGGGGSAGSGAVESGSSGGSSVSASAPSVGSSAGSSPAWGDTRSGGGGMRADAPRRAPGASFSEDGGQGRAAPRGSSGGNAGEGRAAPRGSSSGGDSGGQGRAVPRDRGETPSARGTTLTVDGGGSEPRNGRQRAPVPEYSRPREGRTPIGTPVERTGDTRTTRIIGGFPGYYYDPYYGYGYRGSYFSRYNYLYPGYGFGLGYFYDPFLAGYGGYGGYYGGGGGYYGGGGGGYYRSRGYDTGSLRLKVQPRDAKVYVDGYFVGVVDSFDGVFQKLAVEAGTHRVEIRGDGFEPAQFEIMVTPGETITYKGELKRITQ